MILKDNMKGRKRWDCSYRKNRDANCNCWKSWLRKKDGSTWKSWPSVWIVQNVSLKEDLSNLRSTFDDFLIESSTNGIKISYEDSVGLEVIYHHFFKRITSLELIEYLFFNKDVSNEYICRKLIWVTNLSTAWFGRLIRSFKQNTISRLIWNPWI